MPGIIKELNTYRGMTVRNIKVYAKDRLAVLLSMLTQIIILGLYILFLNLLRVSLSLDFRTIR